MKMHSGIESGFVTGPLNMLFAGVYQCQCALFSPEILQAGAVTEWVN